MCQRTYNIKEQIWRSQGGQDEKQSLKDQAK